MQPETHVHGNDKGGAVYKLAMADDVFIKSIKGRSDARVDGLQIIADNGLEISGGVSGDLNIPLIYLRNLILYYLGFDGRSGSALDKIRAVYATFQNSVWFDL